MPDEADPPRQHVIESLMVTPCQTADNFGFFPETVMMSHPPDAQCQPNGSIVIASRPRVPNRSMLFSFSRKNHHSSSGRALPCRPGVLHGGWGPDGQRLHHAQARPPALIPLHRGCPPSSLSTAPPARRILLQLTDRLLHRSNDSSRWTRHGLLYQSDDSSC